VTPVVEPEEALGEAAVELRGLLVVAPDGPPEPNVTAPTASCTLSGGGGITPLRT
jgi:hypothetical protein